MKRRCTWLMMAVVLTVAVTSTFAAKQWNPQRPINVVIQYAAGGGTDLTLRMLAAQMEPEMGVSLACVNMPGATGAVATDYVWNARRDGYTWLGAATNDVMHYPVMGFHHKTYKDWRFYIATLSTTIVAVSENSKYKTMDDLIADFKARPGQVKIATAGVGASAHVAAEIMRLGANMQYKHVPYQGGYPAIVATIGMETEVVLQHAIEVSDMLRAGKLRALAAYDTKSLNMPGYGEIPPITKWLPELKKYLPHGAHFGIVLPKDSPQAVLDKVDVAFKKAISSEKMKEFAESRGIDLVGLSGSTAEKWIGEQAPVVTWILYDAGLAKNSPEKFGFKKPW